MKGTTSSSGFNTPEELFSFKLGSAVAIEEKPVGGGVAVATSLGPTAERNRQKSAMMGR
jgi:hypothetical protein